ncbi:Alpha/Beta hydrolase protein [Aspergillus granulosus]|uniref:carboxypeptidase C n=1 Tax=Aspergillus granulosus TaxID=176169 RepID=A0ABR4HG14_9EURO
MLALSLTLWVLASWRSGSSPLLATPAPPLEAEFSSQASLPVFLLQLSQDTASVCNSLTPGTAGSIIFDDGHRGNSSMFFWFFESKNNPALDPVILWMIGGPGALSVGYRNLMELGPCRIALEGGYTVPNEFGWNANVTVLFFYGGLWVPALAATILELQADGNTLEVQGFSSGSALSLNSSPSQPTINLKGVMIGNGLIWRSIQNLGFFETACLAGMKSSLCKEAEEKCSAIGQVITGEKYRNLYDIWLRCDNPEACYTEMQAIDEYLNQDAVKEALGVPLTERFQGVLLDVFKQWEELGDLWRASDGYVNYLLESSICVFIYVGDKDLYCNAAGMRQLVDHGLDWHGQSFIWFWELVPWYVEAKVAGRWKAYEPLTYAEVAGAGYLAPFDRLLELLTLINVWI